MENTTQPTQPELTITDLQNIRSVIDVAARRGAFAGAELTSVGNVFNRLDTFLNSVAPPASADESTQPQPGV